MEKVVLIDKNDNVLGVKEKFKAHKHPVPLHRAISIVIFNKDNTQMLITKRASTKPTWGGFWTNAVCTHPKLNETYQEAAERRIFEELGFTTKLKEAFVFDYEAKMKGDIWGECELDHVFTGNYEGSINPNPEEIDEYKWIKVGDLKKDMKKNSKKYTPWFIMIIEKLGI